MLHYIRNLVDYNIICRNIIIIFKALELSSAAIEPNGDFVLIIPTVRFIFKKIFYYKELYILKVSL